MLSSLATAVVIQPRIKEVRLKPDIKVQRIQIALPIQLEPQQREHLHQVQHKVVEIKVQIVLLLQEAALLTELQHTLPLHQLSNKRLHQVSRLGQVTADHQEVVREQCDKQHQPEVAVAQLILVDRPHEPLHLQVLKPGQAVQAQVLRAHGHLHLVEVHLLQDHPQALQPKAQEAPVSIPSQSNIFIL